MRRLPIISTLIVATAVAVMIGLGLWQLQRAEWKEGLVARYGAAANLPTVEWPSTLRNAESLYFRRAAGRCDPPISWRPVAGRNRGGDAGWSHIASCLGGMHVDMGWSNRSLSPPWNGGQVSGIISPDARTGIRLIADNPAPGLEPSAALSPDDIPNNHLFYAIQWFFFAAAATLIYLLAARRRRS